jgi:hypothetical protein
MGWPKARNFSLTRARAQHDGVGPGPTRARCRASAGLQSQPTVPAQHNTKRAGVAHGLARWPISPTGTTGPMTYKNSCFPQTLQSAAALFLFNPAATPFIKPYPRASSLYFAACLPGSPSLLFGRPATLSALHSHPLHSVSPSPLPPTALRSSASPPTALRRLPRGFATGNLLYPEGSTAHLAPLGEIRRRTPPPPKSSRGEIQRRPPPSRGRSVVGHLLHAGNPLPAAHPLLRRSPLRWPIGPAVVPRAGPA